MQTFVNSIFHSFVRELTRTTPKAYFNSKSVIQSSVGMIFRLHSPTPFKVAEDIVECEFEKVELLFTQRAGYEGDRNAYNIVFPGGQCDEGESDILACKRQLFQEVGIHVDQQCIYLGQMPKNFYYLEKRKKNVYITCHIWCLAQREMGWKENLNPQQLRDSKWVDLGKLLTPQNYLAEDSLRLGILERLASRYKFKILSDIGKNVLSITTPELNLGMERNLWGLTLWIWSYALQMGCAGLQNKEKVLEVREWVGNMKMLEVKFKEGFWLKYPSLAVIKGWHYINRVRPFTYKRQESRIYIYFLSILMLGVMYFLLI